MSRIIICGGRDFDDLSKMMDVFESFPTEYDPITIIQGGAKGADFLAKCLAKYHEITVEEYPANWKSYGKSAGNIRNQQMLDEGKPDLVVALPGGRGTADMVNRAKKAGVKVIQVE